MSELIRLSRAADDTLWAVVASIGRKFRIASVYRTKDAAQADRQWREQQVRDYATFLRTCRKPQPHYSVTPIRRDELPKGWRPLPALGFLRGEFV